MFRMLIVLALLPFVASAASLRLDGDRAWLEADGTSLTQVLRLRSPLLYPADLPWHRLLPRIYNNYLKSQSRTVATFGLSFSPFNPKLPAYRE